MRRRTGVAVAAGVISLMLGGCAAPAPPTEATGLDGAWRATSAERNGAPAPDLVGHLLVLSDATFEVVDEAGVVLYDGRFTADPTTEPAQIDFVNVRGDAAGQTWLGIWARDDGTLQIVDNAPDPARPRPQAFSAPAGSGLVAVTFAREE